MRPNESSGMHTIESLVSSRRLISFSVANDDLNEWRVARSGAAEFEGVGYEVRMRYRVCHVGFERLKVDATLSCLWRSSPVL